MPKSLMFLLGVLLGVALHIAWVEVVHAAKAEAASPPVRLAHYYPWYPEHCQAPGWSHYQPHLGCYNSSDQSVIDTHIAWAQYAGLNGFIADWWGPGSPEDGRLQGLLDRGFKWSAHYEQEGYSNPSVSKIRSDLRYLRRYFNHPNWLRINGKPVFFVYAAGGSLETSQRWKQARQQSGVSVYLVMEAYYGFENDPHGMDSWHTYGPGAAGKSYEFVWPYSVTVTPEYWFHQEAEPRLPRDYARFEAELGALQQPQIQTPLQIITSWNEWHDGTSLEPSSDWADPAVYLRIMCRQFKGSPC